MIASLALALVATATDPSSLIAAASSTCAAFPLRSTGTIHYFCDCQAGAEPGCAGHEGNDANTGTSAAAPRRTWGAVISTFNAMAGGDTIALCRGGSWSVPSGGPSQNGVANAGCGYPPATPTLDNPRCAAGGDLLDPGNASTCDLRDYRASWGGTARPLIRALSSEPTWMLVRNGGAGASLSGLRILNLEFRGGNNGPNGGVYSDHRGIVTGSCADTTDSDWLICNDKFDRLYLALQPAMGMGSRWDRFVVRGNTFDMMDLDAILAGTGDGDRIDANSFDNTGGWFHTARGNQAHTVYMAGNQYGKAVSHDTQIVNNEFRRTAWATIGAAVTPVLVGHEMHDGFNVENNVVDCGPGASDRCWAISFTAAATAPTAFRHTTIRRNRVIGGGAGIVLGSAPGGIIEDNVVMVTTGNWKQGIMSPYQAALPAAYYDALLPGNGITVGDDVQNDTLIRNNTVYITGADAATNAIVVSRDGTGHVVANNAVFMSGDGSQHCFTLTLGHCSVTTATQCSVDGVGGYDHAAREPSTGCPGGETCVGDASAYAFVGNNSCYGGSWTTTYDATTHLVADPLFVNPPGDFSLRPTSPLLGAGDPQHASAVDFAGAPRPGRPAIGAYDAGGTSGGATSSGGTSGGGTSGGAMGGGGGGGCGTSGSLPGGLAVVALLALAPRRREAAR